MNATHDSQTGWRPELLYLANLRLRQRFCEVLQPMCCNAGVPTHAVLALGLRLERTVGLAWQTLR
eukprot:1350524-Pyramimonas_sp.AAC.1